MSVEELATQLSGHYTVAVAESCTGGMLGAALTSVAGSSTYMKGGVIAYSNQLKTELLGVDEALIETKGAVSEEVARAMAEGVRTLCHSDIGVGITGVAGPDASEAKPAGLIYVCAMGNNGVSEVRLEGDFGREENRRRAVVAAIELIGRVAKTEMVE